MKVIESGTLHHTCFVVHDVEKAAAALGQSGVGPWGVWTIEPAATTVRGQEVPFSFRIALASVGDSNFELLAPHEGESIFVGPRVERRGVSSHMHRIFKPGGDARGQGGAGAPGA
jgi:Glyoxalase/Bleomycin resistance protein/Dioxygenase superfamily